MTARSARLSAACAGALLAALLLLTAQSSWRWVGTTFPGFFVMANRVVPSIALPEWAGDQTVELFQHQVLAVDGHPVESAAEVYEFSRTRPPGTAFRYRLRAPDGATDRVVVRSRVFSLLDFVLLFGAYLANGLAFAGVALLVFVLKPRGAASRGLLSFGLTTGVFIITAADLYGPWRLFRLHVVAEVMMGAGALHLALVFPNDRLPRARALALAAVYAPFALLAAGYEAVLWSPSWYTRFHLAATAAQGVGAVALIAVIAHGYLASPSLLVRRRVGLVAVGALAGFLLPAVLLAASSAFGGGIPLNAAALTAFLFPCSIGYAIVQKDLFEIDVVLRRTLVYAIVVWAIAGLYLTALFVLGMAVPGLSLDAGARLLLALLNLAVLFAIAPLRDGIQAAIDRLFFRRSYEAEDVLASLSRVLSGVRTLPDLVRTVLSVVRRTLWPRRAAILLRSSDGSFASAPGSDVVISGVVLPEGLEARCRHGELLARYEWDDGSERALPAVWHEIGAELIVPLRYDDGSLALLVLDAKESGRPYNTLDVTLLRAAAGQIELALATAEAFGRLASLNASLEEQVRERTAALREANGELGASLAELRRAYGQLEQSQASLIRADRLASLGRLAAGIAHEMNTPLGAVLNELQSLAELAAEYRDSIDDPSVLSDDHREIAGEIVGATDRAAAWARKAASFIRRMKLHVRDGGTARVEPVAIAGVVDEVQTLLAHRLRASGCVLDVAVAPRDLSVLGDPERLGQVLVNLVVNAVDAYEEHGGGGRIAIRAGCAGADVVLEVEDRAGGIADQHLGRIFDELFTTKAPGRGTGLGLCIARSLCEQSFAGSLTVRSTPGVGSCFTATIAADPSAMGSRGSGLATHAEPAQRSSPAAASLP